MQIGQQFMKKKKHKKSLNNSKNFHFFLQNFFEFLIPKIALKTDFSRVKLILHGLN